MSELRVLVCSRPGTGGAARVLEALFRRLPEHGVSGTAALSPLEGEELLEAASRHGWDVVRLPLEREIRPMADARAALRLRRLVPGHDVVHAHAAKAGALARLAARGVPVVYSPHGFFFTYHAEGSPAWRRYLALERRLGTRTAMLHCVSRHEQEEALRHGLAEAARTVVLPNPVPPPRSTGPEGARTACAAAGLRPGEPYVLMVARLAEPKDPLAFVLAAGLAAGPARFVLVGEGPLLAACRAAAGERVLFASADSDVRGLLRGARAAVLTTRSEALPIFLLEAVAEGVPAVATDLPGCREASGDSGLYVPAGDAAAVAAAVDRLLTEGPLRTRLADAARARAPRFDESAWAAELARLYRRVAAATPAPGRAAPAAGAPGAAPA